MKKMFISNFKSIYEEIEIDLVGGNLTSLIGRNGSGKTNILKAINWFFDDDSSDESISTSLLDYEGKEPIASITLIESISQNQIDSIKKTYHDSIKINFAIDTKDLYNIVTKKPRKFKKIYNDFFTESNGKVYKSFYSLIVNDFISETIKFYNNSEDTEPIDISDAFIINDKKEYLGVNEETLESLKNYRYEEVKIEMLELIVETLEIFKSILDPKNNYRVEFIKNAEIENNIKISYELKKILNGKNELHSVDIFNFLNNFFDLTSDINKLISYQEKVSLYKNNSNSDPNSKKAEIEDTQMRIINLLKSINTKCEIAMNDFFDKFDIYSIPNFDFTEEELKVSVKEKKLFNVGTFSTEFNSSGYKAFLLMIIKIVSICRQIKEKEINYIFLADEPDKNLHLNLQIQLTKFLLEKTKANDRLIAFISSHSPYMFDPENGIFYIVERNLSDNTQSGTTYIKKIYKEVFSLEDKDISGFFTIMQSINILIGKEENTINNFYDNYIKNNKSIYFDKNKYEHSVKNKELFIKNLEEDGYKCYFYDKKELKKLKNQEILICNFSDFKTLNLEGQSSEIIGELEDRFKKSKFNCLIIE